MDKDVSGVRSRNPTVLTVGGGQGSNYLHLVISIPDDIDVNKMTSGLTDQLETKLRRDPKLGNKNYYFGEPFSWGECHVTTIPVSKPEK